MGGYDIRRSNEEVAGLCMRKYMEIYAKYINLKNELEKLCEKSRKDIKKFVNSNSS